MFNSHQAETIKETSRSSKPSIFKWVVLCAGTLIGVAHIGVLGHLMKISDSMKHPVINFPAGDYSSYVIESGKNGYRIEYRANDPAVLESERSLEVDKNKRGLFGGGSEKRNEYRRDQYTMGGIRNIGGDAEDGTGKSVKDIECIVADAGARSQGAMAGTSIAAGALVPAVINIPYIGWLAAGWVSLLGGKVGSDIGSEVGSVFNDC